MPKNDLRFCAFRVFARQKESCQTNDQLVNFRKEKNNNNENFDSTQTNNTHYHFFPPSWNEYSVGKQTMADRLFCPAFNHFWFSSMLLSISYFVLKIHLGFLFYVEYLSLSFTAFFFVHIVDVYVIPTLKPMEFHKWNDQKTITVAFYCFLTFHIIQLWFHIISMNCN